MGACRDHDRPAAIPPGPRQSGLWAHGSVLSVGQRSKMATPELQQKKAKRAEAWAAQKAADAAEARAAAKAKRGIIFKKAATYAAEYQQQVQCGVGPPAAVLLLQCFGGCSALPLAAFGRRSRMLSGRCSALAGEGPDPAQARGQGGQGVLRGARGQASVRGPHQGSEQDPPQGAGAGTGDGGGGGAAALAAPRAVCGAPACVTGDRRSLHGAGAAEARLPWRHDALVGVRR